MDMLQQKNSYILENKYGIQKFCRDLVFVDHSLWIQECWPSLV